MLMYKCNRCGDLYDSAQKIKGYTIYKNGVYNKEGIDICPYCSAELDKWLGNISDSLQGRHHLIMEKEDNKDDADDLMKECCCDDFIREPFNYGKGE